MDRLATRTDPLNRLESYAYDLNGNLKIFTDRKGQITNFAYDSLNRRISSTFADGSSVLFTYDGMRRLSQVTDSSSGTIQLGYDFLLDRLTQEITAQGILAYSYDSLSRRTAMTVDGQAPVTYSYDANSRPTQFAQGTQIVKLGYDASGRRTTQIYPNGTNTNYSYDNASRLTRILHQGPTTAIEDLTYTYDAAGNRISVTRGNGTATLLPNAVQAAYDAGNEQVQFNASTPNLTYDANGNLTSRTDVSGTTTYTWDARNRLIAISGPGVSAEFGYDGFGRRINKTINGVRTDYLYDGNDIIAEISGGAIGASYLRAFRVDEPFVRQSDFLEYYHADALGSTLNLTDSSGTVATTYSYEAYGKTTITGTSTNPFQYTARENDGTGLYYYRARYYNPLLERFISEDHLSLPFFIQAKQKIGHGGRFLSLVLTELSLGNRYLYSENNPLNFIDPLGLWSVLAGGGFSVIPGFGLVGGAGVYAGSEGIGAYGSAGMGYGAQISYGGGVGFVTGNVEGVTGYVSVGGFATLTTFGNGNGGFGGLMVTIGPGGGVSAGAIGTGTWCWFFCPPPPPPTKSSD